MASCTGTTCQYTCNTGTSDCDKGTAPDTDGCECATPSCCGTSCQTTHGDGLGQSFYDCNPLGTFSSVTALEACQAYAASIGGAASNCSDGWECNNVPPAVVCYVVGSTNCSYCWGYTAGTDAGWLESCTCPEASSKLGTWN
jgi:hypothetical protein